ncbi:MAG: hypothetical protein KJ579_03700 [Verrucomicrobia bacterium]|nr:hypothetical protein [Verrucomicrobiota bacterium]
MKPQPAGSMSRGKRILFGGVCLGLGLVAAAGLAELVLRGMALKFGRASMLSHPVLHHVHQPGIEEISRDPAGEIPDHRIRFDRDGLICSLSTGVAGGGGGRPYRVVFMGDSFVEAAQVAYEESFAGLLARNAAHHADVRNYGVASYSPVLHRLQWTHAVESWRPTHVFLMLYDNDFADDEMYAAGAVRGSDGDIVAVPGTGRNRATKLGRASYLARFLRSTYLRWQWNRRVAKTGGLALDNRPRFPDSMPDLTASQIRQLASRVETSGARFILTAVPPPRETHEALQVSGRPSFSGLCGAWARTNGVAFLDLQTPFDRAAAGGDDLFFKTDIHFTVHGHRIVAETIAAAFPDLFKPAVR